MHNVDYKLIEVRRKFRDYYKEKLQCEYKELELQRKIYLKDFKKRLLLCFCGFVILTLIQLIWGVFYYILFSVWICSKPVFSFKKNTKSLVMDKILNFWGDYKYYKDEIFIFDKYIKSSALFSEFNKQKQDDAFKGMYNNVEINVSEQELLLNPHENKFVRNISKNETRIFKGILIALHLDKKYKGNTLAIEKKVFANKSGHQVFLEDVVFSKKWNVYADDQVEARCVLTPALMERMLRVKKLFHGNRLDFSFWEDNLLIAVHTNKDMFETTSLFSSALDYWRVQEVVCQLYSVFSVIDALKLQNESKKIAR